LSGAVALLRRNETLAPTTAFGPKTRQNLKRKPMPYMALLEQALIGACW
jgi:hypothetical protein